MYFYKSFIRLFPLLTFIFIWLFVISIYHFVPLGLPALHIETWTLIFISLFSLSFGYLTVFFLYEPFNINNEFNINKLFNEHKIKFNILLIVIISLFGISGAIYKVSAHTGSIYEYLSNPISARNAIIYFEQKSIKDWDIFYSFSNYLVNFNYAALILGAVYFVIAKKKRVLSIIPLFVAIIYSVVTFQRYYFIQAVVIWFFSVLFFLSIANVPEKKRIVRSFMLYIFSGIFITGGLLLGIVLLRVDYGTGDVDYFRTIEWAFRTIVFYVVGNIVALDNFVMQENELLYGLSLFRGFIKWFIRLQLYDPELGKNIYNNFTNVGSSIMNTYSYIRPFYEDFGTLGLIIINYIYGFIGSIIVHVAIRNISLVKLHFAATIFFSLFLSFFNFTLLNFTMFLFLTIMIAFFQYRIRNI
jgi:oligosaccharide repeat unit polymerase